MFYFSFFIFLLYEISLPVSFYSSVISKLPLPVLCSCCMRFVKKQKIKKSCVILLCYIFPRVKILCYIFFCLKRALVFCIIFFCVWNALWYFVLYFYVCGTRSGILCYIFPHVERALVFCVIYFPRVERALIFCVIFFRVWNALWYFVLYFSACGTRTGILCYIFPHVERALVYCVIFFA